MSLALNIGATDGGRQGTRAGLCSFHIPEEESQPTPGLSFAQDQENGWRMLAPVTC